MKVYGCLIKKVENTRLHDDLKSENEVLLASECQPHQPKIGDRGKVL